MRSIAPSSTWGEPGDNPARAALANGVPESRSAGTDCQWAFQGRSGSGNRSVRAWSLRASLSIGSGVAAELCHGCLGKRIIDHTLDRDVLLLDEAQFAKEREILFEARQVHFAIGVDPIRDQAAEHAGILDAGIFDQDADGLVRTSAGNAAVLQCIVVDAHRADVSAHETLAER